MNCESPQFGIELLFEVGDEFLHDGIYLLVIECALLILQDEVDRIALFALGQVFALIDIKEFDALQQFLFRLPCYLLNLLKFHALVMSNAKSRLTAGYLLISVNCTLFLRTNFISAVQLISA